MVRAGRHAMAAMMDVATMDWGGTGIGRSLE